MFITIKKKGKVGYFTIKKKEQNDLTVLRGYNLILSLSILKLKSKYNISYHKQYPNETL